MKNQKWLILCVALALMAGTAGALMWLRANQKLGKPGIKATPIPGSVMMKIELPERVLDFTSTNVPEPEVVLGYLPKDTSFVERYYQAPDGLWATGTIILMGADRTSIHRPDYCLPGQGWTIESKTVVKIPIGGSAALSIAGGEMEHQQFVQTAGRAKAGSERALCVLVCGGQRANHRTMCSACGGWRGICCAPAYCSAGRMFPISRVCAPGQEEATFERMKKLIAASVPEFQWPPGKALNGLNI